ncbi:transporter substrate-binding domain-containing protein [Bradyrhizobium sp.]|uniref:transporter substrate-binding domain-containing protein n=1 Tax=Bradyrhizobium sp. TaxID=376 RepID=UPI002637E15E|nr:transporter substrate-binding domain-containing protein [Bradyrhizobium sp.]
MKTWTVVMATASVLAATSPRAFAQDAKAILAPTGKLRVGVYLGSPTSLVHDPKTGESHGLSFELGHELAKRLGVPFEQVNYQRISEIIEGMKAGDVDFTISNSTPARAASAAFSQTLLTIELGYLVAANSPIASLADIQKAGLRIGVTKNSTSQSAIPKLLPTAIVAPAENYKRGIEMLERGEIDTYATNKPILFEMSDQMPGSRILEGRWGEEHLAVAIPKEHAGGLEYIKGFVDNVRTSGLVARLAAQAGLRGAVKAQ